MIGALLALAAALLVAPAGRRTVVRRHDVPGVAAAGGSAVGAVARRSAESCHRTSERGDGDGDRGRHRRAAHASGRSGTPAAPPNRLRCKARSTCSQANSVRVRIRSWPSRRPRERSPTTSRQRCGRSPHGRVWVSTWRPDCALPQPIRQCRAHWTRLAVCWELAHRHGLAIATLMRTAHREFVERDRFESRFTAAMAGARTTALVLAGLPVLGVGLGQLVDADPVHFLLSGGLGGALLVVGTSLACAGLLWSDHITSRTST